MSADPDRPTVSGAYLARLSREAREIKRMPTWPNPYLPEYLRYTVVVPATEHHHESAFTFGSKEQARAMRDKLNGMTLEGQL